MSDDAEPPPRRVRPYGARAALVDVASAQEAAALGRWLRGRLLPADADDAIEVVPAARTVLVDGVGPEVVEDALRAWSPSPQATTGPLVELAITYDGADLAFAAQRWGVGVDEVGSVLRGVELTAAFCGFAPGFAYLAGLPRELWLPRLEAPRSRVEPGSLAVGGEWCGVYPSASPGGWRLLGRTRATLWDPSRTEPALLAPGTRVRLVEGG